MAMNTLRQLTTRLRFLYGPGDRATNRKYKTDTLATKRAVTGLAAANLKLSAAQNAVSGAFAGSIKSMGGYAAVLGVAFGGREIVQAADQLDELNNRLRAVVGNRENIEDLRRALTRLSVDNFSNIEDTAQIFQRFKIGTEDVGVPTDAILEFTDSVQKSAALSGANAQETNNALIQFAQGIASNRFSGEELRSVSEQLPTLLRVLKRDLNLTTGELRELAFAGGLTSDVIFTAFNNQRETILKEFENIQVTQQKAAENLRTGLFTFFGKFGQGAGLNRAFANAFQGIAQALIGAEQAAYRFGLSMRGAFRLIFDATSEVYSVLNPIFGLFSGSGNAFKPILDFFSVFNTMRNNGYSAGDSFRKSLAFFFDPKTAAILEQTAQSLALIGKVMVALSAAKLVKGLAKGMGSLMATFAGVGRGGGLVKMLASFVSLKSLFATLTSAGSLLLRTVFSPITGIILGLQVAFAAWNKENSNLKKLWQKLQETWNGGPNGEGLGAAFARLGSVLVPVLTFAFDGLVTVVDKVAGFLLTIVEKLQEAYDLAKDLLGLNPQSAEEAAAIERAAAERGIGVLNTNGRAQYNPIDYIATSRGQGSRTSLIQNFNVTPDTGAKFAQESGKNGDFATADGLRLVTPVGG